MERVATNLSQRVKFFLKERKEVLLDIGIILLLGCLSFTWFRGNNLISGGDFGLTLDWIKYLKISLTAWDKTVSFGVNPVNFSFVPLSLFGAALQTLGFNLVFIEKILFYLWFVTGGFSMYFLCNVLGSKRLGRIISSIFYMLNPFSLMIIWRVSHGLVVPLSYAIAPLSLGLFIRGVEEKNKIREIVISGIILFLVAGFAYGSPRTIAMHIIPILFYFFSVIFFKKEKIKQLIKFTLLWGLIIFFLNFFWFFPTIDIFQESSAGTTRSVLLSNEEEIKLTSVGLFKSIRMIGYWSLYSGYKGEPYYQYWKYYLSPWIMTISWLIPGFVILGLFQKQVRKKQYLFFFLGVIFFGLWGIKGSLPPLGGILTWVYRHVPYSSLAARFSFLLYGSPTYLIFSILLGFGFVRFCEIGIKKIGKLIYPLVGILSVLLFIVLVLPFWNGDVIKSEGKLFPGERFKIPDYWIEAKSWLSSQKDFFRVLPLPMTKTYNTAFFAGEGYSGMDVTRWFVPQPYIFNDVGASYKIPTIVGELIEKRSNFDNSARLLGLLNIKYFLLRDDTRWDFLRGHDWWFNHSQDDLEEFIAKQKDINLEKQIGKLKFYKVDNSYILPNIYSASSLAGVDGKLEAMEDIIQLFDPRGGKGLFFNAENPENTDLNGVDQQFIWVEPSKDQGEGTKVFYNIDTYQEGNYDLFFRDDNFSKYYRIENGFLEISLDGQIQKIIPERASSNLLKIGNFDLSKGGHNLTITLPEPEDLSDWNKLNLLEIASFSLSENEAHLDLPLGQSSNKKLLNFTTGKNSAIIYLPIVNFRIGNFYKVSFAVDRVKGSMPFLAFWENEIDSNSLFLNPSVNQFGTSDLVTSLSTLNLLTENKPVEYSVLFNPQRKSKMAGVGFIDQPNSVNTIRSLKIERVFNNPILLSKKIQKNSAVNPEIVYREINQGKYEIEVKDAKNPYFLVFTDAFNSRWKISTEGRHINVNGYANGWYIMKTGDYKITLSYEPQSKLKICIGVSLFSFLFFLFYLVADKAIQKKHS